MVLAPSGRQPSAKNRAAAFRQKAKIYTNRNIGGTQIAITVSSTKYSKQNGSTRQLADTQRKEGISLTNSSYKPLENTLVTGSPEKTGLTAKSSGI